MKPPIRESEPSSPLSHCRLKSPEPSKTPELTSRSLHRIPDEGVRKNFCKSLGELVVYDSDDDEEWQRNLCTEPAREPGDYEGRWQSLRINNLMQGTRDLDRCADLITEGDSRIEENDASMEARHFFWDSSGQNKSMVDDLDDQIGRGKRQKHHSRGNLEFLMGHCTESYTPDNECSSGDDQSRLNYGLASHFRPQISLLEVDELGVEPLLQVKKPLKPHYTSVGLEAGDATPNSLHQDKGDFRSSQHNQEQFWSRTQSTFNGTSPLQDRENPDELQSGLVFGDAGRHQLWVQSGAASIEDCNLAGMRAARHETRNSIIVEIPIIPSVPKWEENLVIKGPKGSQREETSNVSTAQSYAGIANPVLRTSKISDVKTRRQLTSYNRSVEVTAKSSAQVFDKSDSDRDAKCSQRNKLNRSSVPMHGANRDGQMALMWKCSISEVENVNQIPSHDSRAKERISSEEQDPVLPSESLVPIVLQNLNPEKEQSIQRSAPRKENPTAQSSSRKRVHGNVSTYVPDSSRLRKSHPLTLPARNSGTKGSYQSTASPVRNLPSCQNNLDLSLTDQTDESSKQSVGSSARVHNSEPACEQVAGKIDAVNRHHSDSTDSAKTSIAPQDATIQSNFIEQQAQRKTPSKNAVKGQTNEDLENRFLELVEKVASIRPNHATEGSLKSSPITSPFQLPLAQKLFEFQKQVEELQDQVEEVHRQKQNLAQRFVDQRREFERISQAKHELWETKLRELQKDKYELQIRLQTLGEENPRQRIKRHGETINLTETEIRLLRQEITEQEALIRGYQIENEKAVKRLKDLESTYKERTHLMAEENARLASQLANMQFAASTTEYRSTPNTNQEMQGLRIDLHALQTREASLKLELEKERKTNAELEKCLANLNRDKEEEQETLKTMLAAERLEHARAVDVKEEQSKLHLDSQELVKSLQSTIQDQVALIADLRRKLEVLERDNDIEKENATDCPTQIQNPKHWNNSQKAKALKQIESLQKQVKHLEAIVKQGKDLSAGTQQIGHSVDENAAKVKRLQEEVAALQRQVREDDSHNALESLKQEHEQLKQEYKVRFRALNEQFRKERASFDGVASTAKKEKFVDKQVEDLRTFYIKKVRDLAKQLEDARKVNLKVTSNVEPKRGNDKIFGKIKEKQAAEQMAKLEDNLSSKDATIKKLQQKIKDLEVRKDTASIDLAEERKQLKRLNLGDTTASVKEANRTINIPVDDAVIATSAEIAALRKQLESAEIAKQVIQKTCTEAMERAAMISVQHQQTILNLKEAHAIRVAEVQLNQNCPPLEVDCQRFKNQELERENKFLELRVKSQLKEIGDGHANSKSPRLAQVRMNAWETILQILREKVKEMEARQKLRAMEWQGLSQHTKRLCALGMNEEEQEQNWQTAMAAKSREIEDFRREVDEAALAFQRVQPDTFHSNEGNF